MPDIRRIVEALLFAAEEPLTVDQLCEAIPEADAEEIRAAIEEIRTFYDDSGRGFMLAAIAGGYQVLTRPELGAWVERFLVGKRRQRLSRASLEVLAIVAYKQPITRGEIEEIRGVDCGGVLRTLLEKRLVAVKGRARTVGHPLLYVTTQRFLEHFGLDSLADLPKLEEFSLDSREAREELVRAGLLPAATPAENGSAGESAEPTYLDHVEEP